MKTKMLLSTIAISCASCSNQAMTVKDSFENLKAGVFSTLNSQSGIWNTQEGAEINCDKAADGKASLHILGGNQKLVFTPSETQPLSQISFVAERWSNKGDFSFRVEKQVNNRWTEIYNGDAKVKTGHFSTPVTIKLNGEVIDKIRFVSNSPQNTGVLIDNVELVGMQDMQIKRMKSITPDYPVLKRKEHNPIYKICIEADGTQSPLKGEKIAVTFDKNAIENIESVQLIPTGSTPYMIHTEKASTPQAIDTKVTFTTNEALQHGKNYFWISAKLKESADIKKQIAVTDCKVEIEGKEILAIQKETHPLHLGIALRQHNDDHCNTYRIPGLTTTNKGTLIAVYDNRYVNGTDLQGDIDIGMSRSTDGGNTWEPMKVIMDMGEWHHTPQNENGIGDPCVMVDTKTNTIWSAAVWAHGHPGQRNWTHSKPGLKPEVTSQQILVKSTDDGKTWSKPINITKQVKDPQWNLMLQGPGRGITMKDGTMVFPAQFKDENQMPHSTIMYSKDRGKTWHIGTGAKSNTTEAQVIELADGSLMLNMRDNRNRGDHSEKNGRSVYITKDLGKTWTKHITSRTNALQESTCQASIIRDRFIVNGEEKELVLFSNPNTQYGRNHMTIKISTDEGATWNKNHQLLLDEGNSAGYSCLTKIDDHTVGILYEGSQAHMTFQAIPIEDIYQ